ncbi:MAG: hypothetical protein U9N49_01785, partial [Campylobacterota bacterium]|nr:hypothetical protein [Campylobacterota bacterium]
MFYVLNQDNQIVAADYDLLEILESNNLQTLFVQVATGEISFEKVNDRKINIQSSNSLVTASHEEYVLKTTFGDLTLVKLYNIIVKSGYGSTVNDTPHAEVVNEPVKDIRPKRTASIFADDEEKAAPKARRASIFIEDEEIVASTPKKEEISAISDIANEKVQGDLLEASQK